MNMQELCVFEVTKNDLVVTVRPKHIRSNKV